MKSTAVNTDVNQEFVRDAGSWICPRPSKSETVHVGPETGTAEPWFESTIPSGNMLAIQSTLHQSEFQEPSAQLGSCDVGRHIQSYCKTSLVYQAKITNVCSFCGTLTEQITCKPRFGCVLILTLRSPPKLGNCSVLSDLPFSICEAPPKIHMLSQGNPFKLLIPNHMDSFVALRRLGRNYHSTMSLKENNL